MGLSRDCLPMADEVQGPLPATGHFCNAPLPSCGADEPSEGVPPLLAGTAMGAGGASRNEPAPQVIQDPRSYANETGRRQSAETCPEIDGPGPRTDTQPSVPVEPSDDGMLRDGVISRLHHWASGAKVRVLTCADLFSRIQHWRDFFRVRSVAIPGIIVTSVCRQRVWTRAGARVSQ